MASGPRRVEGVVGEVDWVKEAQSRGECPGDRITLREERLEGGWVEVVGGRRPEDVWDCGCMRVLARTF